jgi:hypothetical protein
MAKICSSLTTNGGERWIESAGIARVRMPCLRAAIGTDAGNALGQGLHPLLEHVGMG